MRNAAVVGIGRLGGALALAIAQRNIEISCLVHRSRSVAVKVADEMPYRPILTEDIASLAEQNLDLIIITTGDPQIADVADELKHVLNGKQTVLHTSGSLSSNILSGLSEIGCAIGSVHPLVSISDYSTGKNLFEGAYFCVEGDSNGYTAAVNLAKTLGGRPFRIDGEKKALYHAAAVMACGHVTALIDLANSIIGRCEIEGQESSQILLPLIESTILNIQKHGTDKALTGSFARADADAVERHLALIRQEMGLETLEIYKLLGELSLRIMEKNNFDNERISKVRKLIQEGDEVDVIR